MAFFSLLRCHYFFLEYTDQLKQVKFSVLFFLFFYYLIRFNIGRIYLSYQWLRVMMMIIGDLILIFGCWVNLKGRMVLGKNWSNQIKIYKDHYLVTNGVYQIVRHPLYASIVWMFFGASLIYVNYLSFLANIFIFVPFMYYRAKQEEGLLIKEFKDYKNYQLKVGMFFPKIL
jgi:protein-S-isoprenylcysteine O-methyltransferase Ste14